MSFVMFVSQREGMVPFANGMNDRVEVLSQFMSLVCERSQTLSDALCNLVYAVTGLYNHYGIYNCRLIGNNVC